MSGGSWDYICYRLEELADSLSTETDPMRVAMSVKVRELAKAMHDIEWVDSGDYGKGDDTKSIKKFLGKNPEGLIAKEQIKKIKKLLKS